MRLTLRNLLAYLHETLEPPQREAFQTLVAGNPRVGLLIDRCRNLAAKRLAAPTIDQASPTGQAETVAKYLDFTLPDEQVAEFEKAVLACDELLSEIVDSHAVLADVVKQRIKPTALPKTERILALHAAPATPPAQASAPAKPAARVSDFAPVAAHVKAEMHDSGDLTDYLSDDDDDEELSLDTVQHRAEAVERRAMEEAAHAFSTGGGGTMTATAAARAAVLEKEEAYRYEAPVNEVVIEKKKPLPPTPVLAAIGGGVAVLLVGLVWAGSSLMGGKPVDRGPYCYGVSASPDKALVELRGTIKVQPQQGGVMPDAGALVVVWPVKPSAEANRLTTSVLIEDLDAKRQNPYNEMLVIAKCDDDGNYRLRMHAHDEYHVMVLSQRLTAINPKTWGEAVEAIAAQLEDPAALIGVRQYEYRKLAVAGPQATLDYLFNE